jgi:hypothetical protein
MLSNNRRVKKVKKSADILPQRRHKASDIVPLGIRKHLDLPIPFFVSQSTAVPHTTPNDKRTHVKHRIAVKSSPHPLPLRHGGPNTNTIFMIVVL